MTLFWLVLAAAALLGLIILEGRRQERKYGPPQGRSLVGTGMLELQRHLQADRKVEMLIEKKEQIEQASSGEGPESGKAGNAS